MRLFRSLAKDILKWPIDSVLAFSLPEARARGVQPICADVNWQAAVHCCCCGGWSVFSNCRNPLWLLGNQAVHYFSMLCKFPQILLFNYECLEDQDCTSNMCVCARAKNTSWGHTLDWQQGFSSAFSCRAFFLKKKPLVFSMMWYRHIICDYNMIKEIYLRIRLCHFHLWTFYLVWTTPLITQTYTVPTQHLDGHHVWKHKNKILLK